MALFPLREWAVTGHAAVLPSGVTYTYTTQQESLLERFKAGTALRDVLLPNAAFLVGWTSWALPTWRPHPWWAALWGAYGVALWRSRRTRQHPTVIALHLFVGCYVAVMLPNAYIWSYGYRHVLPLLFVLALFVPGAAGRKR